MWLTLFGLALATAACFGMAAFTLQHSTLKYSHALPRFNR
jgi:hypothetical protein